MCQQEKNDSKRIYPCEQEQPLVRWVVVKSHKPQSVVVLLFVPSFVRWRTVLRSDVSFAVIRRSYQGKSVKRSSFCNLFGRGIDQPVLRL